MTSFTLQLALQCADVVLKHHLGDIFAYAFFACDVGDQFAAIVLEIGINHNAAGRIVGVGPWVVVGGLHLGSQSANAGYFNGFSLLQ